MTAERPITVKVRPLIEGARSCARARCRHRFDDHTIGGCIQRGLDCECRAFVVVVCDHPSTLLVESIGGRTRYELCRLCGTAEAAA